MPNTRETVLLGAWVPPEMKEAFVAVARENDRNVSAEIRRALRLYLAKEGTSKKRRST